MRSCAYQPYFFCIMHKKLKNMRFTTLGLSVALLKALADQQFTTPTPIQQAVIPAILTKKDVLGIAKTGSGKTAGYVLPILTQLQQQVLKKDRQVNVLVLIPTRELAVQVKEVFELFSRDLTPRVKTMAVFGGASINPQMMGMQGVHVLVATPGRLLELVANNAVQLSAINTLVLDEADKMLNVGFQEEMNKILALLPPSRQNILFSATLSDDVNHINQLILKDPQVVKIEAEADTLDTIKQLAYLMPEENKGPFLRYLIHHQQMEQVLVFASSGFLADAIVNKLRKNNITAKAMHGKKSQGARTEALYLFKKGKIKVLVATDLMARGIDISFLPYVINYDLPRSPKDYVHRIGRTGRAEAAGEAISLVTTNELQHLEVIQKKMGKQITLLDTADKKYFN